jgi:glycosyltransferase involved in cell wall biosynthesis
MQGKKIIIAHNWKEASFNTQTVRLAEALSLNNQVLFVSQMRVDAAPLKINDNLTVVEWPNNRPQTIKDILFFYKKVKQFKPTIAIGHFTAQNIIVFVGSILGIQKRIVWYHTLIEQIDLDYKGSKLTYHLQRFKRKLLFKFATKVVLVSNYSLKDMNGYYAVPTKKTIVINNGIPDHSIRNNGSSFDFVFLGRYDECKGIDILLEAIGIVKKQSSHLKFHLAGGKFNKSAEAIIAQYDIASMIVNHGFIDYTKVFEYLANGYAFIIPSRIDNLPTVVMEAFSCGTPVIGSKSGGIPEMIEDNVNGLLFEKENAADLAAKIIFLANNKDLHDAMGIAARKNFEQKFTIPRYVANVTTMLECL